MSLIYFPQLAAGRLPAPLPGLLGGPAAGWAPPLARLSEGTPSSAGITHEFRPRGVWAARSELPKSAGGRGAGQPAGRREKAEKVLVPLQVFAVLFSLKQVIPTPGPQFPHRLNGCEQLG